MTYQQQAGLRLMISDDNDTICDTGGHSFHVKLFYRPGSSCLECVELGINNILVTFDKKNIRIHQFMDQMRSNENIDIISIKAALDNWV